ncbi:JmjC domain-containing protein [Paraburkholderia aspalathi]|nr:cupin domain-containing protein [Paraburkholderia aspalathi]MBK3824166.1 hypothetical protein [Paraburkholderia aspalathi]MBK3836006.1 hypothetical protein [Paraburkholderia aspalathi]MBK3865778.1 hypothetical protein [Paraburkholderia aspalathi]
MTPLKHIDASDVNAHYQAGGTICITGINQTCADLRLLSATCKMSLGWSGVVDCRAYLSCDGGGYTPHFDDKCVITFQIEGCKRWEVCDAPAVRNPVSNAGRFSDGVFRYFKAAPETESWEQFEQPLFCETANTYTLNPGDILVVPAGVWHSACAIGNSLSIALTLNHVGCGSVREIIFSALERQLMSDPVWRGATPMAPHADNAEPFESMCEIDAFFIERLHELRQWVDKNLADRTEIVRIWAERMSSRE